MDASEWTGSSSLKSSIPGHFHIWYLRGLSDVGETLSDPAGVEAGGTIKGMGLLPMDTVFSGDKTRTRVQGTFTGVEGPLSCLNGVELEGYEIHMGVSTLKEDAKPLTQIANLAEGSKGAKGGRCVPGKCIWLLCP